MKRDYKKPLIDLSDWDLGEIIRIPELEEAVQNKIQKAVEWVIGYIFNDPDNHGHWFRFARTFSSRDRQKTDNPLDLHMAFPVFNVDPYGDTAPALKTNLREFIEFDWLREPEITEEDRAPYVEVSAALRTLADEIDEVLEAQK